MVPKIGSFFTMGCILGILLAIRCDPHGRYDASQALHRWAGRYMLAVQLQGMASFIVVPWLLAVCQDGLAIQAMEGVGALAYTASQVILCHVTVLRLRVVASKRAATKVGHIFNAATVAGTLSAAASFLRTAVGGNVGGTQ